LSDGREFQAVLNARCGRAGAHIRLLAQPNGLPHARLGVVVGRKVCALAVGRNYMKRVCRELFRHHAKELAGLDVVVLHHKAFIPGMFESISAEFGLLVQSVQKCRDSLKPLSAPTKSA
jgi:ribonuclease P protein component